MDIKWTGLDKLVQDIVKLGGSIKQLPVHLKKAVPFLEGSVKRNIDEGGRPTKFKPKADGSPATLKKTSLLVAGINGRVEGNTIVISSPRVQSSILHFGGKTKPHVILPRRKKALAFQMAGKSVFAKRVNHPGSVFPARPYMLVINKDMDTAAKIIAESIAKGAIK